MMDNNMTTDPEFEEGQGMAEGSPIDSMIAQVQGYMEHPESVTRETLQGLIEGLTDIKGLVDGGGEEEAMPMEGGQGMAGTIGRFMGGEE